MVKIFEFLSRENYRIDTLLSKIMQLHISPCMGPNLAPDVIPSCFRLPNVVTCTEMGVWTFHSNKINNVYRVVPNILIITEFPDAILDLTPWGQNSAWRQRNSDSAGIFTCKSVRRQNVSKNAVSTMNSNVCYNLPTCLMVFFPKCDLR